jgi:DNA-damage-inducible protein J
MKSSIVRARIDASLKAQASSVLAACGLEMSDALRLFLVQVVAQGGLPFAVRQAPRVVPAKKLTQMKRASQVRDRALLAKGGAVGEQFLIRPALIATAKVRWPKADLSKKR